MISPYILCYQPIYFRIQNLRKSPCLSVKAVAWNVMFCLSGLLGECNEIRLKICLITYCMALLRSVNGGSQRLRRPARTRAAAFDLYLWRSSSRIHPCCHLLWRHLELQLLNYLWSHEKKGKSNRKLLEVEEILE